MENQNFIPDRIGSTQNPLSEKFNGAEGAKKEKRTPDNSQASSNTDDLHFPNYLILKYSIARILFLKYPGFLGDSNSPKTPQLSVK
jgi:hypothetical protein